MDCKESEKKQRLLQALGQDKEVKKCEQRMGELKDKLAKAGIK